VHEACSYSVASSVMELVLAVHSAVQLDSMNPITNASVNCAWPCVKDTI